MVCTEDQYIIIAILLFNFLVIKNNTFISGTNPTCMHVSTMKYIYISKSVDYKKKVPQKCLKNTISSLKNQLNKAAYFVLKIH